MTHTTTHGVSIVGSRGLFLVVSQSGATLAYEPTYKAACDCVGRLSSMRLRAIHSMKLYTIRMRRWREGRRPRPTPANHIYGGLA